MEATGEGDTIVVRPAVAESIADRLMHTLDRIPRPGVCAMFVAAVLFSANTALAKLLGTQRSFSSFQILFFRGLITTIGSSLVLFYNKKLPIPHLSNRVDLTMWALGRGVLGAFAIGSLYFAVATLPLTESVVLYSLNPVWAAIFSRIFLKEAVTLFRLLAIPLFLAGVVVSVNPSQYVTGGGGSPSGNDVWVSRIVVVFGSVCSGVSIVFARKLNAVGSVHWCAQAWWQGTVAALLAPIASGVVAYTVFASVSDVMLMLGMGLCAMSGQLLVGIAIQREHAAVIGILWNFDTVFSVFWQATLFHKSIQWYDLVGIAFVFLASVVCVLEKFVMEWWHQRMTGGGEGEQEREPFQDGEELIIDSDTVTVTLHLPSRQLTPHDATHQEDLSLSQQQVDAAQGPVPQQCSLDGMVAVLSVDSTEAGNCLPGVVGSHEQSALCTFGG